MNSTGQGFVGVGSSAFKKGAEQPPTPMSDIEQLFSSAGERLTALSQVVADLESRLFPVMAPAAKEPVPQYAQQFPPMGNGTAFRVESALGSQVNRLDALVIEINGLIQRLQI